MTEMCQHIGAKLSHSDLTVSYTLCCWYDSGKISGSQTPPEDYLFFTSGHTAFIYSYLPIYAIEPNLSLIKQLKQV